MSTTNPALPTAVLCDRRAHAGRVRAGLLAALFAAFAAACGTKSNNVQVGAECVQAASCTDDGNPCTTEECVDGVCKHAGMADKAPCPSGLCWANACCQGCWDGSKCNTFGAADSACGKEGIECRACDDANSCTHDACTDRVCTSTALPDGDRCEGSTAGVCVLNACNCGDPSQPCCAGATCQAGALCSGGTCEACGATGQPCCPGTKRCDGNVPQQCDVTGVWHQSTACPNQACAVGACVGSCTPGTHRCAGNAVQTCDASGTWNTEHTCAVACGGAVCQFDSCAAGGAGMTDCGATSTESCCTSLLVTGGSFSRSYDRVTVAFPGPFTDPQHRAMVGDFRLDKYEITVGRFRKFVDAVVAGWTPAAGAGKHSHLNGGSGLVNGGTPGAYEAGWDVTWNASVPTSRATWDGVDGLACYLPYQTWTSTAGANEKLPINCVSWYQAAAFCIWDGGFLPSEAEWNYAAAGGAEQRVYPWSTPATSSLIDDPLAVYCGTACTMTQNVGSKPNGNGKWGQSDLAGNVWEWTLDGLKSPYNEAQCSNCAYTATSTSRVRRGGGLDNAADFLLASARGGDPPTSRNGSVGARCARTP